MVKQKVEKTYKDLSPKAKKGFDKFASFSVKKMRKCGFKFEKKMKKNPHNIYNKELFFKFVKDKC